MSIYPMTVSVCGEEKVSLMRGVSYSLQYPLGTGSSIYDFKQFFKSLDDNCPVSKFRLVS